MPRTAPRDPSYSTADLKPVIFTPDALPAFADQGHRESLHQKDKRAKKLKPTEPIHGAGKGGRLGQSATQGLVQDIFMKERINEDVSLPLVEVKGGTKLMCLASGGVTQIRRQKGRRRKEGMIASFHYSDMHIPPCTHCPLKFKQNQAFPPLSLYFWANSKIWALPSVTTFSAGGLTAK